MLMKERLSKEVFEASSITENEKTTEVKDVLHLKQFRLSYRCNFYLSLTVDLDLFSSNVINYDRFPLGLQSRRQREDIPLIFR